MSDSDKVISFQEAKDRLHPSLTFVVREANPDGLDEVRMAKEALELTQAILDEGEGYNRPRQIAEGDHGAAISYLEEHAEYLENFLEDHANLHQVLKRAADFVRVHQGEGELLQDLDRLRGAL